MSNDLCWSVYVHTNKLNGKRYFGITSIDPKKRWLYGHGYRGSRYFYYAIQKYGWDGFDHRVIISGISKAFAEIIERSMIEYHKTRDPQYGYNIQVGGITGGGLSDEGLQSLRECNSGINAKNRKPVVAFDLTGKKVAEFSCIHDAEKHFGAKCLHHHIYSRHGTRANHIIRLKSDVGDVEQLSEDDLNDALSIKYENGIANHVRSVVVFDAITGEKLDEFPAIIHAAERYGEGIKNVLYGNCKTVHGVTAMYADQCIGKERLTPSEIADLVRNHGEKEVFQFSKDRKFIKRFSSLREASNETGVSYKALSQCLSGKIKSSGGYLWSYSIDDVPESPCASWETRKANGTTNGIPVDQIDLKTGDVITTYASIGDAAKATGTYKTSISQIINHVGNHVSAAGYGWKYHDTGRD